MPELIWGKLEKKKDQEHYPLLYNIYKPNDNNIEQPITVLENLRYNTSLESTYEERVEDLFKHDKEKYTHTNKKEITLKQDDAKQYIQMDIEKMEVGKMYVTKYQNETYVIHKLDESKIEIYHAVE